MQIVTPLLLIFGVLGELFWKWLQQKPPWSQYEGVSTMFKIGNSKELPTIPDHLSDDGKDFVWKCLQRNPLHRPTAAKLLQHRFVKNASPMEKPVVGHEPSDPPPGITNEVKSMEKAHAKNRPTLNSDRLAIHSSRVSKSGFNSRPYCLTAFCQEWEQDITELTRWKKGIGTQRLILVFQNQVG